MKKLWSALLILLLACQMMVGYAEEPPDIDLPEETQGPSAEPTAAPGISWLDMDGILCLVNRDKKITKAYVPADLITPRVATRKKGMEEKILMRREAARALEEMFTAAQREANHVLYAASGYRSFGIQQLLFNTKVEAVGSKEAAQRTVAPAGASEHQLGLAMDIQSPNQLNLNRAFGDTEEGKWVAENAQRFGFIIRYQRDWTKITGYAYEPWHIRYVGVAHAKAMHALQIPMETYIEHIASLPEYVLRGATDYLFIGLVGDRLAEKPVVQSFPTIPDDADAILRGATAPYLPEGTSYETALWAVYPTPRPTAGPRVDLDEESSLFSSSAGGVAD